MTRASLFAASVAGGMLIAGSAAVSDPPASPAAPGGQGCFFINQFENWKAPDAQTIIIRVNMNQYYRLDLAGRCPALLWPDSHLITHTRGPDTVCSAVDWDLKVSQGVHGIAEPCIVKTMTALSPAEVQAIPKKFKP